MTKFVSEFGAKAATSLMNSMTKAPASMYSMGRSVLKAGGKDSFIGKTIKSEVDSLKSFKGAVKTAFKGGIIAGAVEGTIKGVGNLQQEEQLTSFLPEDAQRLEQSLDKQVPRIKAALESFTQDTVKTTQEVLNKLQAKVSTVDTEKVGFSDGVRVDKAPITTGITAALAHITDNKTLAAIPAIVVDVLFTSGPQTVAHTTFSASSKIAESVVTYGVPLVKEIGSMAVDALHKQTEKTHLQDVVRDHKQELQQIHDKIDHVDSKNVTTQTKSPTKEHDSGRSM